MPFKKGQSGNEKTKFKKGHKGLPGAGRPRKLPRIEKLLADVLGEEKDGMTAAEAILKALRYKAAKGDIKAAQLILERAYGKPKQFIEQSNKNEIDLSKLSEEELFLINKINNIKNKDVD